MIRKFYEGACSMHNYCDVLRRDGFTYSGEGCYGRVYVKDDIAVKFGPMGSNSAYLEYVDLVAKNKKKTTWLPRIDALFECEDDDGNRWFAVQLERLECGEHLSGDAYDKHEETVSALDTFSYSSRRAKHETWAKNDCAYATEQLERAQPNVKPALDIVDVLFTKYTPDVHNGNVMRRKNGEYVITDPVC